MKQAEFQFSVSTKGRGIYKISKEAENWVQHQNIRSGLLTLFIPHTSASLLIQENADPDVLTDLNQFFNRLVPDGDPLYDHQAEALKLSRKALKINPKLQAPYWVIGEIYLLQGKVKDGIKVLLEAHNLDPKNVETLKKLASGYIKNKEYASAKKFLEKGLHLDDKIPGLHYNLAVVYTNMGNGPKAMEHIELALEQYEDLDTLFWAGKSRDTRRLIERKFKLNK
jgi:tetratricopeptide (TPR) repeat protein